MTSEHSANQARRQLSRAKVIFFVLVFVNLFAVPILWKRLQILNEAYSSKSWPTTEATIIQYTDLTDECRTESAGNLRAYMCKYIVKYEYQVAGIKYESSRVSFIGKPLFSETQNRIGNHGSFEVVYNPADPASSAMFAGDHYFHGGELVVATELAVSLIALAALMLSGSHFLFWKLHPDLSGAYS